MPCRRLFRSVALAGMASLGLAGESAAQLSPAMERATVRARAMLDDGNGVEARTLLDSLVTNASPSSIDLADALYWRAVLAERVADAELDWKRLVTEIPLSPRAPDALQRLGELDMLRGHPAEARVYFARVLRDYANASTRTAALLWTARSYFDERNGTEACRTMSALATMVLPEGELSLQTGELQKRCLRTASAPTPDAATPAAAAPTAVAPVPSPPPAASPPEQASRSATATVNGRYSVQLAAYDTRADADGLVRRLASRQIEARVDGSVKPFRVRVGRFATRTAAGAELARLAKLGHTGFIAELTL